MTEQEKISSALDLVKCQGACWKSGNSQCTTCLLAERYNNRGTLSYCSAISTTDNFKGTADFKRFMYAKVYLCMNAPEKLMEVLL